MEMSLFFISYESHHTSFLMGVDAIPWRWAFRNQPATNRREAAPAHFCPGQQQDSEALWCVCLMQG